jgi:hypothetical protein
MTTANYNSKITTFYTENQAIKEPVGVSHSPMKPFLLMEKIGKSKLSNSFEIQSEFPPFLNEDFYLAHESNYVNEFFLGNEPAASSNFLKWNSSFAESIRYTNSSLFHAQKYAVENPESITFSPTSGFHHATPYEGRAFCTFSGQVISAVKLFRERGVRTTWIDLDGHFGNSIEDSRQFVPDLKDAIPEGMNVNPMKRNGSTCLESLSVGLKKISDEFIKGKIHSICFAQGADSHIWDDLRVPETMLNTVDWILAHQMVFQTIQELCSTIGRPIPLTLSLFGGYRKGDYDSVLNLHMIHLQSCLEILCKGEKMYHVMEVLEGRRILLE